MWLEQDEQKTGYQVDLDGYITAEVKYRGEAPEGVITVPIPEETENPRWNGADWVEGDEYYVEKDPVDALAEELLDFKIAYSSVPCQYHQEYPVLVNKILEGDDE